MAIAEIPNPYLEHSHDDGVVSPLFVTRPMSGNRFHQKLQLESNWATLDDQPLTNDNIAALFSNIIPTVRHIKLLSSEECARLVRIIEETETQTYNQNLIFPPVSIIGISQFNYGDNQDAYLSDRTSALILQDRFVREAQVDVIGRVMNILRQATGLQVRMASEGERQYFAGILRVVDNTVSIHADFAPHDCQRWEIGRISGQLTWNILLAAVPGGETIIYDRQWDGKTDDAVFRKPAPSYAYSPTGLQGRIFKVMPPIEGDVTFFNSRNFHEVRPCDRTVDRPSHVRRFTMSSFVGLLEVDSGKELVLWS